ncbi:hypothetical protein [Noviherbaspirillum autotrophicum]|nr:hypothetical protein [Noviherbaspirillum autotrophicum]
MSIDLDTPQRASIPADTAMHVAAHAGEPPFFAVSLVKLTVMSVCTAGFYELYWYYRNWQRIRQREGSHIMPFWRAFFSLFFCYSCFARIRDYGKETGMPMRVPAALLAAGWTVTTMLWKLPDPYWWASSLAVVFLLPAQAQANRLNAIACPGHQRNARLSAWNWLVVALGGSFTVLALIGTFVPE